MYEETTEKLLEFISKSPTAFQAAEETRKRFLEEGFTELKEEESWNLEKGGKYFVMRNHSAIIGFSIPVNDCRRYHIIASHSDSPSFKIKENPEMSVNGAYVKLNVERYGGMILSTWFDRPLSVAGRMIVRKNGKILEKLVNIDRDLVMIPSLAIHMNRDINGGYHYNVQKDMLPLYSGSGEKGNFMRMMAEEAEVRAEDILGHDLFLYNRMPGTILFPVQGWMICSVLSLRWKVFFRQIKRKILQSTVYWITKRWGVPQNREQHPHFLRMCCSGSIWPLAEIRKVI